MQVTDYLSAAVALAAEGAPPDPRSEAISRALSKTRVLTLFAAVPLEIRNAAMFDRADARAVLKTDAARKLYDDLMAEAWGRVRWLKRGPEVAVASVRELRIRNFGRSFACALLRRRRTAPSLRRWRSAMPSLWRGSSAA